MPQLKAEHPISAFALSLLVTAVQCQQSVNCIESELSSHFLNASTEGGTTPTKFSFQLYGRATCVGDRRQIIWGFNTVDITRAKKKFGWTRYWYDMWRERPHNIPRLLVHQPAIPSTAFEPCPLLSAVHRPQSVQCTVAVVLSIPKCLN